MTARKPLPVDLSDELAWQEPEDTTERPAWLTSNVEIGPALWTIQALWLLSGKKKAAEACDFNGLFCYLVSKGGLFDFVAVNSLKS